MSKSRRLQTGSEWANREETRSDRFDDRQIAGLDNALGRPTSTAYGSVPPLRHWLFFQPRVTRSGTGVDGHPNKGGFLPPVDLPRRMWAAGSVEFHSTVPVNALVGRKSRVASIDHKRGQSGQLVFVTLEHRLTVEGEHHPAITESQLLVYREMAAASPAGQPAPAGADWETALVTDEVLLFRYSALTGNAHRIHYDRQYATEVEGYPDLVVHGPLQATCLMDAWCDHCPGLQPRRFSFRARAPSHVGEPVMLCGARNSNSEFQLWLRRADGTLGMIAHIEH